MRHVRFFLAALAVGALAAGPLAGAAGARLLAPTYQSSDPEDGAMMDHPPSEVTATFSEPLDASSEMSVFDECGTEIDSGPATVDLTEMTVGIGKTPAGTYKVVYTAVGVAGVTGQTKGSFDFMVHHGQPCKKGGAHPHPPGKGNGKGKGHGDHKGRGDQDAHDDHDGGGDDHDSMGSGTDHSGNHSSDTTHGGGHTSSGDGQGRGHGDHPGGGNGDRPGGGGPMAEAPNRPVASGPGGTAGTADAQAMLIGLGLALLVGVLGGWLLRNSPGLAGPA